MKRTPFGFAALNVTQFLGAANDNVMKAVLVFMLTEGIWAGRMEAGQSVATLCLTIPFILFSGFAGQFADRYSKRSMMVLVKLLEIPMALLGMIAFLTQSLWLALLAMVLLATQSAFFGPAKYGVIPELVDESKLSRANGTINMATNVAVIFGTLLAGRVSDGYIGAEGGSPMPWLPGVVILVIALFGVAAVCTIPRLPASSPSLRLEFNFFRAYLSAIRDMSRGPVLLVALAWAFFYLVGMLALLILPEYKGILQIDFEKTSRLLGLLGLAIGVGSVACGWASAGRIRPLFVGAGGAVMTVCFIALGLIGPSFTQVAILLVVAGAGAGFYIVPLQALMQKLAPEDERGRFLGAANGMSFVASSISAAIYWLCAGPLGMPPNRVFLVAAGLCGVFIPLLLYAARGARHAMKEHDAAPSQD